jgi:flap endonuclease-1
MGIKKLFSVLSEDYVVTPLESLVGKVIAIDASHAIYSAALSMPNIATLTDKNGKSTVHLNVIFNIICKMWGLGIKQVWVFDTVHCGGPTEGPGGGPSKEAELAKRAAKKSAAAAALATETDIKKRETLEKQTYRLTRETVNEIKTLLTYFGLNYIEAAPGIEAEQIASNLTCRPLDDPLHADYCYTGDSDAIIFGAKKVLRKMQTSAAKKAGIKLPKNGLYYVYDQDTILTNHDLTMDQLVSVGIALGTDFSANVPGVGEKTVIDKVKKGIKFTTEQLQVKDMFSQVLDNDSFTVVKVQSQASKTKIADFLAGFNFNKEAVLKKLKKL